MTKEPIMINDVDVSGCEFYINSKNLEFNCKQTPQSYFCKNQPNCYYKQLKRKEEECEELRDELEWVHGIKDQLKVENEEFKKTVLKKCPQCGEEYLTPKGAELYDENNLLKQTLHRSPSGSWPG